MIIRPLAATDLTTLESLAAAAEHEGFRFLTRFVRDLRASADALDTAREFFLGAVIDDRVVGVGGVTPDPYVAVGAALMRALEARACQQYDRLRLLTDTRDGAAFYERLGYLPVNHDTATHEGRCPRDSVCA
jgi:hypothetical protein